jgi:hypothetical protein
MDQSSNQLKLHASNEMQSYSNCIVMKQSKNTLNQVIDFLLILPYLSLKNKVWTSSHLITRISCKLLIKNWLSRKWKQKKKRKVISHIYIYILLTLLYGNLINVWNDKRIKFLVSYFNNNKKKPYLFENVIEIIFWNVFLKIH